MEHQQVSGGGPAARAARAVTQARIVESVVERLVVEDTEASRELGARDRQRARGGIGDPT